MNDYFQQQRRRDWYPDELDWQELQLDIGDGICLHGIHGRQRVDSDGPTLVLLHEALGHLDLWKDFPLLLARATGLDVFMYERRGYGGSTAGPEIRGDDYLQQEAPLLVRLLDLAGLNSVVLVGHSDGGSIALVAAEALAAKMQGIVTIAAHIRVDPLTVKGVEATRQLYLETDLPQRLARYHGDKTDQLFWLWNDTWLRQSFRELDLSDCLAGVGCPALIIQGAGDQYAEIAQMTDICDGINCQGSGRAEALLLQDCQHVPHIEAKSACVAAICEFVAGLPRSAGGQ